MRSSTQQPQYTSDMSIVRTELVRACRRLCPRLDQIRSHLIPDDRPEAFAAGDVRDERTRRDVEAIDTFLEACKAEGIDR